MGLAQSPKVITNGLVFYYDQNNIKSYKGPAIQNLAPGLASNYGSVPSTATGRSYSGGTEVVNVPQLGPTSVAFTNIQNNYTSFTPNSTDCCPSPHTYTGNFAVSPSTLYTYAIVYRCLSGYTHPNFMYRYEYTSNGGTYVTEAGVHNTTNRIHLGDGWYWAWATFTTQATTNWIAYAGSYYYRYSDKNDKFSIAKVLIAQGDYTGLHPKYWPNVNTTRASTAALQDLLGKTSITMTSTTFSSNGAFSFNGGTQRMDLASTIGPMGNNWTISAWINSTNISATQNILSMNGPYFMRLDGSKIRFNVLTDTWLFQPGTTTLSSNTWYFLTMVWNGTANTWTGYINDVQEFSVSKSGSMNAAYSNFYGYVGYTPQGGEQSNFFGQIPVALYYNRALSAEEVRQNFNALRGRYGI